MSEQPEWTPEQQEMIDYVRSLDPVTGVIAVHMMNDCSLRTLRRLLPLVEIAWRGKDPSGALLFLDIDTPNPRVEYVANQATIALHQLNQHKHHRYVLPLRLIPALLSLIPPVTERVQ